MDKFVAEGDGQILRTEVRLLSDPVKALLRL